LWLFVGISYAATMPRRVTIMSIASVFLIYVSYREYP
jgi:hypothetical protein